MHPLPLQAGLDIDNYKDMAHYPSRLPPTEKKLQPRRRCRVCYKKGVRRDSNYMCVLCPEQPSLCLTPCFNDYHAAKMCPVAVPSSGSAPVSLVVDPCSGWTPSQYNCKIKEA